MNEKAKDKKQKRSMKQRAFYNRLGERTLLGKFFLDKEGNLKEVPVGITAVLVLIILISLVVQIKEPAEETVVRVTHLFKSSPPPTESQKTKAEEKKKTDQKESAEEKARTDEKAVKAEKQKQAEEDLKTIKEEIEQMKKEAAQMKREAEKTLADAKQIKEEAEKLKAELKKPLSAKDEKIKTLKNKLAGKENSLKEAERKSLEQKAKLEEAEEKLQKSELKLKNTTIQLAKIEEEGKNKILKETLEKSKEVKEKAVDVKDKSETVRDEATIFKKSADNVKEKSKEVKSHLTAIAENSKWPGAKEKMASLKISDEEYTKLYQARFASGAEEPDRRYRWRVSNRYRLKLKDCYTLFDMKAVALTEDGRYYDLSDYSQLTEDYLNKNYSSTVIMCENPEVDFGGDIKELGLRTKDLTVRYYMYNHTRNYFYHRVEQAVACCLRQGKIPREKNWQERIDVVGNVYKIKKESGGFGVFIPTSVYYRRLNSSIAEEIRISPACFENEEDVKILKAKNLL